MKREDGLPLSFTSSLPFLHLHKGDNSIEPKCFTALQASLGAHQSTSQVVLMNQQINQITDLQSQQMSFLAVQKFRNPGMFQDEMGMVQSFGRGRTCPLGSAILSYLPCMIVFDMCKDFHVSDGCLADSQRHSRVASVMPRE